MSATYRPPAVADTDAVALAALAAEAVARAAADALKQDASTAATDVELTVEAAARAAADLLKQDAATAATDVELAAAVATDRARLDAVESRSLDGGNLGTTETLDLTDGKDVWLTGVLDDDLVLTVVNPGSVALARLLLTQDGDGGHGLTISYDGDTALLSIPQDADAVVEVVLYWPEPDDLRILVAGGTGPAGPTGEQGPTGLTGAAGPGGFTPILAPIGMYVSPNGTYGNAAPAATNRAILTPVAIGQSTTFDRIGIEVVAAAAAGGIARLGIYASDGGGGMPGTLILDAGTVAIDVAAAGPVLTIARTLASGIYWMVTNAKYTGSPTIKGLLAHNTLMAIRTDTAFGNLIAGFFFAWDPASGFPSTCPAVTGQTNCPAAILRRSA